MTRPLGGSVANVSFISQNKADKGDKIVSAQYWIHEKEYHENHCSAVPF